jgi:hypothetical protein
VLLLTGSLKRRLEKARFSIVGMEQYLSLIRNKR